MAKFCSLVGWQDGNRLSLPCTLSLDHSFLFINNNRVKCLSRGKVCPDELYLATLFPEEKYWQIWALQCDYRLGMNLISLLIIGICERTVAVWINQQDTSSLRGRVGLMIQYVFSVKITMWSRDEQSCHQSWSIPTHCCRTHCEELFGPTLWVSNSTYCILLYVVCHF